MIHLVSISSSLLASKNRPLSASISSRLSFRNRSLPSTSTNRPPSASTSSPLTASTSGPLLASLLSVSTSSHPVSNTGLCNSSIVLISLCHRAPILSRLQPQEQAMWSVIALDGRATTDMHAVPPTPASTTQQSVPEAAREVKEKRTRKVKQESVASSLQNTTKKPSLSCVETIDPTGSSTVPPKQLAPN